MRANNAPTHAVLVARLYSYTGGACGQPSGGRAAGMGVKSAPAAPTGMYSLAPVRIVSVYYSCGMRANRTPTSIKMVRVRSDREIGGSVPMPVLILAIRLAVATLNSTLVHRSHGCKTRSKRKQDLLLWHFAFFSSATKGNNSKPLARRFPFGATFRFLLK